MNIFGIGGAELVLIILIMLVVAGPQRMIRWAYHLGRYTAILRRQWSQMMDVVQKEVDAAGLDVQVPRDLPNRQNVSKFIQDAAKPWADPVEKTVKEVTQPMKDAMQDVRQVSDEANSQLQQANQELKNVGSWNGSQSQAASTAPAAANEEADEQPADENFGAWTAPQPPGQRAAGEEGS